MRARPPSSRPLILVAVLVAVLVACRRLSTPSAPPPDPGQALYGQGKYVDALPLLEKAAASGRSGTLLYQVGFCKGVVEGRGGPSKKALWEEAEPLLEKEIDEPHGATLDRLYYLTAINYDQNELDTMRRHARQAVDQIERGGDPNSLTGEDWFRLARLHEFLQEGSEAEAAYRRAVSFFHKTPAQNPSYQALALARVADLDFDGQRYAAAATGYDQALHLVPDLDQVRPFVYGRALLAAGRFDDAVATFSKDRDANTATESQYAADMARKAKDAGGLNAADSDGTPISGMPGDGLDERIKRAGKDYRAAREKNSFKQGDPLPAEVADVQKRFVALLCERLLKTGEVQEFCLREGLADLVRR